MALTKVFDGQTGTGPSIALTINRLSSVTTASGAEILRHIGFHCAGITDGSVDVEWAPPDGDWVASDTFTANFFKTTPVSDGWRVRLNCTDATDVNLVGYIG